MENYLLSRQAWGDMVVDEYSRTIFIGGICRSIGYGTCASIDDVTIALSRSCNDSTIRYIHAFLKACRKKSGLIYCLDELWDIFQQFGDVCDVNVPGKRSRRKHSKNRRLIPGNLAFFFV